MAKHNRTAKEAEEAIRGQLNPGNGNGGSGRQGEPKERDPPTFTEPIPASALQLPEAHAWIWHGYLAPGSMTLMSALWKAGKTTLLAHLLRALGKGGTFCGHDVEACNVLIVTEESQGRWARRRDAIGIADNVHFLVRPFQNKSDWLGWTTFIEHIQLCRAARKTDLIVFDPLVDLWPVKDENDASQMQAALMPLRQLTGANGETALFLIHHTRKGDGQEATASRGSGVLTAFVDTIIELRRFDASERSDRRRVLTAYGRDDETPEEVVIELAVGASGYVEHGDRNQVVTRDLESTLCRMLPSAPPGWSIDEIKERWEEGPFPRRQRVLDALREGTENGFWRRVGTGVKSSPYTYWTDAPSTFGSGSTPIRKGTESDEEIPE